MKRKKYIRPEVTTAACLGPLPREISDGVVAELTALMCELDKLSGTVCQIQTRLGVAHVAAELRSKQTPTGEPPADGDGILS